MIKLLLFIFLNTHNSLKLNIKLNSNYTWFDLLCLTPLSAIFQLYHGDQF